MSRRKQTQFSIPKAIAVTVVLCAFILVKFAGVQPVRSHKKRPLFPSKLKTANLDTAAPMATPQNLEPISNPVIPTAALEPVTPKKADCLSSFSRIGRSVEVVSQKGSLDRNSKLVGKAKITKKIPNRSLAKRHLKRTRHFARTLPLWIEQDLESNLDIQDALDNPSPLDELAFKSFSELPAGEYMNSDELVSEVQWRKLTDPDFPFEMERRLYVKESVFQKMDFDDLRTSLTKLENGGDTDTDISAPEVVTAWGMKNFTSPKQLAKNELDPPKSEAVTSNEYSEENVVKESVAENLPPSLETNVVEERRVPSPQALPEPPSRNLNQLLGPSLAAAAPVDVQPVTNKLKVETIQRSNLKNPSDSQNPQSVITDAATKVNSQVGDEQIDPLAPSTAKIYGEVRADDKALAWIKSQKAHVELYLNKLGSRDPQDSIYLLGYQYPGSGESFEIDGSELNGKYNLMAGVYVPNSAVPVAQVRYSKIVSSENYKEKIQLYISGDVLSDVPARAEADLAEGSVPLNLTLFDGAPGNYRKPKVLDSGEIRVVGIPELGSFSPDKNGNVRIPKVPISSELIIEAKVPGYYPTKVTVPIFTTPGYSPVYLIQKDKVDVVTNYFTKRPQQPSKSFLMGRSYDPKTRTPVAGETLALSHRRGPAVYFGALPDIKANSTLNTGMFGFYNVEPSFRAVTRGSNRAPYLLNLENGFGYFFEFGRGGSRKLLGRLFDPFNNQHVFGSVQLVGSYEAPEATRDDGKFSISDLDLPPGVVTLEVNAEGYPRTWFTIPWTVREAEKEKTFYLMERDLIRESAIRIARAKHEKNTGVIVGGVHSTAFKPGRESIGIQLFGVDEKPVSGSHGPFSLTTIQNKSEAFNLTTKNPGFTFFNLKPGEYLLRMLDSRGKVFRTHVVRVGVERVSIVVN